MNSLFKIILIVVFSLLTHMKGQYHISVVLSLEKDCLSELESVLLQFEITNNEKHPFYMRTGNLMFETKIVDEKGIQPTQDKLIESTLIGVDEFIKIEPQKTNYIKFKSQFFDQFIFEPGITYSLQSTYSNTLDNKKDKKVKTLKGEIPISTLYFKVCE